MIFARVDLSTGVALVAAAALFVALILALAYLDYRRICRRCDERVRPAKAEPVDYAEALRPSNARPTSDERWGRAA